MKAGDLVEILWPHVLGGAPNSRGTVAIAVREVNATLWRGSEPVKTWQLVSQTGSLVCVVTHYVKKCE